ncbi:hypothetical protein SUGI_0182790 [Cryptomeria japonica]|nr:hypothetical protein SUGI_0182790 [Cryptomeria japonica]
MASSSLLKLSRSLSRVAGLSGRANAGGGCCWRGFATYELSDKDSEDDIAQEPKNTTQNNDVNSNGGSKFNERAVQHNFNGSLYRAIILGEVGQVPIQKRLRNGQAVTVFSVGTGGIRNNRRPLESESPREYADRGTVQWHRVSIYTENLGAVAMQHLKQGAHVLSSALEKSPYDNRGAWYF